MSQTFGDKDERQSDESLSNELLHLPNILQVRQGCQRQEVV